MDFSRRQFIVAAGSAAVLAACGDSSSSSKGTVAGDRQGGSPSRDTSPGDPLPDKFALIQRFPTQPLFQPGEVRLAVSVADNSKMVGSGPSTINGWIEDFNQQKVADVVALRRSSGIAVPYWEVRATLAKAVVYTLRLEGDDGYGAAFEVFEAGDILTPLTGARLPPFDTPTVDDHRGVEPYCTLTPKPCPLHDITLTQALQKGTPVAYMIGTPAHCQTGTCAPGLEFLVDEHRRVGDKITMVHADVYTDDTATVVAPAPSALQISYEPVIYFCTADGVIVDRLDAVWDAGELTERIDLLLAS